MNKNAKPSKKTVDIQHSSKIQTFSESNKDIEMLKHKIEKAQIMLNTIEKRKESHELNDSEFNRYMSLKDDIAIYNKQINEIENSNDELDYLVNTGSILFKYYDIVDNGTSNDDMAITSSVKQNSILKFFVNTSSTEIDIENDMEDRATLSEQYMAYINDNYTKINVEEKDKCSCCESTDRSVMTNDGLIYCNSCNTVEYIIVDHDRPSYKDPPREISYFAYKRRRISSMRLKVMFSWLVLAVKALATHPFAGKLLEPLLLMFMRKYRYVVKKRGLSNQQVRKALIVFQLQRPHRCGGTCS